MVTATAPRLVASELSPATMTTSPLWAAANANRWQTIPVADWYAPWLTWPAVMASTFIDMQQAQLGAWAEWQRSWWSAGQDGWDAWRANFSGGAPIDG